jgi:hypothetical protein
MMTTQRSNVFLETETPVQPAPLKAPLPEHQPNPDFVPAPNEPTAPPTPFTKPSQVPDRKPNCPPGAPACGFVR